MPSLPELGGWQQASELEQAAGSSSSSLPALADTQLAEQDLWPASSVPFADPSQHLQPAVQVAAPSVKLSKDAKREDARRRNRIAMRKFREKQKQVDQGCSVHPMQQRVADMYEQT